jgi:acyl dehydratase
MSASKFSLDQAQASIGREIGVSDWLAIGQDRVFEFARVTEDFQFIHVDPEKAAATAFGGTIAHGFLALSLLSTMFQKAIGHIEGSGVAMNYGFESVRFISPVHTGRRIRARFTLKDCAERKPGQWRMTLDTVVEVEREERPALVAEWLVVVFADA